MSDKITGKKKNIMLVIAIVLFGLLLAGGTYAYRLISASITNGSYNVLSACFDIDYDEGDEIRGTLFQSSGPKGGLSGEVTMKVMDDCSLTGLGTITLHVKEMTDSILLSEGALKYAVYDNIEEKPLSYGVITYVGDIDIYSDFKLTRKPVTYYIYIWLDGNIADNEYVNASFDGYIGASAENVIITGPEAPVLDSGMIPVKLSSNGTATTVSVDDVNWYNYDNKEWANVVLVDDDSRSSYKNTTGVTVNQDDILAYYVWIPRYKYQIWTTDVSAAGLEQPIDIVFESVSATMSLGTGVGEYRTHPAFWWDNNSDGNVDKGEMLAGIWVGKFETTGSATKPTVLPNKVSMRLQNVRTQFATSQKFSASGNVYGLSNQTTDAHMMKNSEWGAVVYLAYSDYGINQEIYINNSSSFYTGRSGGNVSGSVLAVNQQYSGLTSDTVRYSVGGYYTWIGQTVNLSGIIGDYVGDKTSGTNASTTGNVTGIYDMSGGTFEYVMGNYNNEISSSGFSVMPASKYYDEYTTDTPLTACNDGICYGHALSETSGWYDDDVKFVRTLGSWLVRGGEFSSSFDANTGVFSFRNYNGSSSGYAWRSVLAVGYGA